MNVVEQLVRSFARQISKDGKVALTSNAHPALVAGFADLGWPDPYIDPTLLPTPAPIVSVVTPKDVPQATSVKGARGTV